MITNSTFMERNNGGEKYTQIRTVRVSISVSRRISKVYCLYHKVLKHVIDNMFRSYWFDITNTYSEINYIQNFGMQKEFL